MPFGPRLSKHNSVSLNVSRNTDITLDMDSSALHPHGIDALDSWNLNAEFWDEGMGRNGNKYWSKLQEPCLQRFLGHHLERDGCLALEFATGNGLCARWLAERGAQVLATDGALNMLERAKAYESPGKAIEFRRVDVTSEEDLTSLSQAGTKFDIILMNMAIMDVSTIEPLARALPKLLSKDGVFVATILHPVFMTSIYSRTAESKFDLEKRDFDLTISKSVTKYIHVPPYAGVAVPGQEHPQVYFHRPICELLSTFFREGLVVDGFEEPCFTAEDAEPARPLSTANFVQLPPILGFRIRLSN